MRFFSDVRTYNRAFFRKDLFAAFSIACLVIPQSIAYALLADLPVISGLYSAIFGTFIAAMFSRSSLLMSGPSTAMAILVQTAIAEARRGTVHPIDPFHVLSQLVILVAFLYILFSLFNIGRCLQFVSRSVMLGYFSGLSVVIIIEQMLSLVHGPSVGKPIDSSIGSSFVLRKMAALFSPDQTVYWTPFIGAILGLAFLFFMKKKYASFPSAFILLFGSAYLSYAFTLFHHIPTLNASTPLYFSVEIKAPSIDLLLMREIFPSALAIALLGVIEAFSAAKALSAKSKDAICHNQDVFSLGMANSSLSLFPFSMPASASVTRSLLAYNVGGKTRLSGMISSCFVYGILFFFWPCVSYIPLFAFSALLIFTALHVVDRQALKLCFRATKEDAWIFSMTFFLCMVFRLDIAFIVGAFFSIGFYLRSVAIPHFQEYAFDYAGKLSIIQPNAKKHSKVRIIGIGGELFFGVVDVLEKAIANIAKDDEVKVVVLRLNNVHHMDGSMCLALVQLHEQLQASGRHLLISGITTKVWRVLERSEVLQKLRQENFFLRDETRPQLSTWKACLRAEELLTTSISNL